MAITWGSWQTGSGHQKRLGYDFVQSPASVGEGTTSVSVTLKIYLETNWGIDDPSNTFTVSGGLWSESDSLNLDQDNGDQKLIWSQAKTINTSYSGSVTRSFSASLSGINVIPGTATVSGSHTVARRPYSAPSAPSTPSAVLANITSTGITTNWSEPSNWGGNDSGDYELQISTSPTFASGVTTFTITNSTSKVIGSLSSSTTYYMRVRAYNGGDGNGGGYSAWSGTVSFSTVGVPFAPASGSISGVTSTTAVATLTVNAGYAGLTTAGNSPTGSRLQVSTSPAFTSPLTFNAASLVTVNATGLTPATLYYARVAHTNASGVSSYTSAGSFTTGAPAAIPDYIKIGGVWRSMTPWVKVSGTWRQVSRLWVKVGGTWR